MDSVKSWVALIALTSIVSAVFCSLAPGGRMKTALSVLVGTVFVCAVLSPFSTEKKIDFDLTDDIFDFEKNEINYEIQSNEGAKSVAENGYETAVKNIIEKLGYGFQKVTAVCDDKLQIKKISIVMNGDFSNEKIVSEIKDAFGEAEIEIRRGESDERETRGKTFD